jgi:hypothetical protein
MPSVVFLASLVLADEAIRHLNLKVLQQRQAPKSECLFLKRATMIHIRRKQWENFRRLKMRQSFVVGKIAFLFT